MLPGFTPEPLRVTCNSCGASAETWNGTDPDSALECGCCPLPHSHAVLGCRTVTITATARLTMFDAGDLLDAAAAPLPATDMAER
jgi:hypothetical protein